MKGVHDVWLFSLTVLVLNATPGVDMMITASRTLQHGLRGGLPTAFGISAGCVVHALAAAFGLAALLAASAAAFAALKWVGAAYLAWLALGLLRAAGRPGVAVGGQGSAGAAAPSAAVLFRQGLLTNLLNPKIPVFFLALLPQFIDADAVHKTTAFLALGAIMVAQGTVFIALFVLLVAGLRRLHQTRLHRARQQPDALRPLPPTGAGPRPPTFFDLARLRRALQAAGGLLLLALAARLALTEQPG